MELLVGTLTRSALAGAALTCAILTTTTSALAAGDDLNLTCSGNNYTKNGPFPTAETLSLKIAPRKPVIITQPGSNEPTKYRIVANNAIQLKFGTDKFSGEYFYFTGDLFLIHRNGRLTRMTCQPS